MKHKSIFLSILLSVLATGLRAQSTNEYNSEIFSAYSRYGLGTLMPKTSGMNNGMGGAGIALPSTRFLNTLNPASYATIDSLTFLFDIGMSLDRNVASINGKTNGRNNARVTHAVAAFRLVRRLGLSIGYRPYSCIGYDYSISQHVGWNENTKQEIRSDNIYHGTGGMHQVYLGLGYSPFRGFSLGFNVGYMWGEYDHAVTQTFVENGATASGYMPLLTIYDADLSTYSLDFGAQYSIPLDKKNTLSVGATFGLGHKMNSSAEFYRFTSGADTINITCPKAFSLPMTIGGGLAFSHAGKLHVAFDVDYQRWSKCDLPTLQSNASGMAYVPTKDNYKDRFAFRIGGEYCPNPLNRHYVQRIRYRVGAYYQTPYIRVNGINGPKEYGVNAGLVLPITNGINNRSSVNVGFNWSHVEPSSPGMVRENQYSITLGLTFNEQWFLKWKIK